MWFKGFMKHTFSAFGSKSTRIIPRRHLPILLLPWDPEIIGFGGVMRGEDKAGAQENHCVACFDTLGIRIQGKQKTSKTWHLYVMDRLKLDI